MEEFEPESKHEPHLTVDEVPTFESKPVKESNTSYETPTYSAAAPKSQYAAPCNPAFPTQFFPPNPPRLESNFKISPPLRPDPSYNLNPPRLESTYTYPPRLSPSFKLTLPCLEPINKPTPPHLDPNYKLHSENGSSTRFSVAIVTDESTYTSPVDLPPIPSRFHQRPPPEQIYPQRNINVFNKPYTIVRPMCSESQPPGKRLMLPVLLYFQVAFYIFPRVIFSFLHCQHHENMFLYITQDTNFS